MIESKQGFTILRSRGVHLEYSRKDKVSALRFYYCLRHLEGYEEKLFDDVNEAVLHIFNQKNKLMGNKGYSFDGIDIQRESVVIPEDYYLNIIHEQFDITWESKWNAYDGLLTSTKHDRLLRKAMLMCMHIIIKEFRFSMFDYGDGASYECMDIDEWLDYQVDNLRSEIADNLERKPQSWETYNEELKRDIEAIEEDYEDYKRHAPVIQKRIMTQNVDVGAIKRCIKKHAGTDTSLWMQHILMLKERNFCLEDYMVQIANTDTDEPDDEDQSPQSVFGYMYSNNNSYHDHQREYWQSIQQEGTVVPICSFTTVSSLRGIVHKPVNVPLFVWIYKVFDFDLTTHKLSTPWT